MREATVIEPGGGEVVGDTPERRVEILAEHDAMHATTARLGARRDGADLHVHRHHTDVFYVLEGELTVRLGREDAAAAVPPGTLARVPPLVVHGFRNRSGADVRYLNFHAPGRGFADYLRALRDGRTLAYDQEPPPADGVRPPSDAVVGGGAVVVEEPRIVLHADLDAIAIAEVRCEPSAVSQPAHVHGDHVESLYVLEGEIAVAANGRELRAPAGAWVDVAAGVAHAVLLPGDEPARVLEVHAPGRGFGAFLRALAGAGGDAALAAERSGFDQRPAP